MHINQIWKLGITAIIFAKTIIISANGRVSDFNFNIPTADRVAGRTAAVATFSFTPTAGGELAANSLITLNYPTGFFASGAITAQSSAPGVTLTVAPPGASFVVVTVTGGTLAAANAVTVTLAGLTMGSGTIGGDITVQTSADPSASLPFVARDNDDNTIRILLTEISIRPLFPPLACNIVVAMYCVDSWPSAETKSSSMEFFRTGGHVIGALDCAKTQFHAITSTVQPLVPPNEGSILFANTSSTSGLSVGPSVFLAVTQDSEAAVIAIPKCCSSVQVIQAMPSLNVLPQASVHSHHVSSFEMLIRAQSKPFGTCIVHCFGEVLGALLFWFLDCGDCMSFEFCTWFTNGLRSIKRVRMKERRKNMSEVTLAFIFFICFCSSVKAEISRQPPIVSGLIAYYTADSWSSSRNRWIDVSGSGNHVTEVGGTTPIGVMKGQGGAPSYVYGGTTAWMKFPVGVLPSAEYTLLHVARYNGDTRRRIFQGFDGDFISGFYNVKSGVSFHPTCGSTQPSTLRSLGVITIAACSMGTQFRN